MLRPAEIDEASVCGRRAEKVERRRRDGGNEAGAQRPPPSRRRKLFRISFYAAWFAIWAGLIGRPAFPDAA